MYNNIVACSRNHGCSGKAIMYSACIVEVPVTVNYIQIFSVAQQCFYGDGTWPATEQHTSVFVSSVRYLCPSLTKIRKFWTDFHKSIQYQISRKSTQSEARRYMGTDGQTGMKKPIGTLCDCANAPKMPRVFMLKTKKEFVGTVCVVMRFSE